MKLAFLFLFIFKSVIAKSNVEEFFQNSVHTNNWAVLVCSSRYIIANNDSLCFNRFWFNYRHVANVLSFYQSIKRLGIPDR
jgi:phosphatidylinositol glycan class K